MRKAIVIMIFFVSVYCNADVIKMKFQWYPQAQFAGFIMAEEKGFFEENNLEVEFIFSDGSQNLINELKSGEIDYCTAWLTGAIRNNDDKSVVNIMQILQNSSLMIVSDSKSGIETPDNLNGRKIRLWSGDFDVSFNAFIRKHNLKFDRIEGSYNMDLFLSGACEATAAMYYNEYYKLYLAGKNFDEMNTIFFSKDPDMNFPEDGLYVTSKYMESNRNEVDSVRKAVKRGWEYARDNKEETINKVLEYCSKWKLKTNYAEQRWMLETILESAFTDDTFGELDESKYKNVREALFNQKMIKNKIEYNDFIYDPEGADNEN